VSNAIRVIGHTIWLNTIENSIRKKLLKKILICIVFTRIQFFQHMFLKKTKKEPRDWTKKKDKKKEILLS